MNNCTAFCNSKCEGDHHPLLKSLFQVKSKNSLNRFDNLLRAYLIYDFQLDDGVPDSRPTFRYPLIHWAAVLGRVRVMRLLLQPPYNVSPRLTTHHNQETPLHRLLDVMDKTVEPYKILAIVELLHDSLACVDAHGNTPFHACADALVSSTKGDVELWRQIFHKMIDSYADKTHLISVLNSTNGNTETVLHMLSKRDSMLDLVEYLLCLGVDLSVCNANGETAVEVAWRFSMTIYNFYHLTTSSGGSNTQHCPINASSRGSLKPTSSNNTSLLQQQCNIPSTSDDAAVSIRTTRASLGLSQTKDYTEFFKDGSSSDNDGEDSDHECSLKRKVSAMNRSLIERLNEISPVKKKKKKKQKKLYNNQQNQHQQKRKRLKMMDTSDERNSSSSSSSSSGNELDDIVKSLKSSRKNQTVTKKEDGEQEQIMGDKSEEEITMRQVARNEDDDEKEEEENPQQSSSSSSNGDIEDKNTFSEVDEEMSRREAKKELIQKIYKSLQAMYSLYQREHRLQKEENNGENKTCIIFKVQLLLIQLFYNLFFLIFPDGPRFCNLIDFAQVSIYYNAF